MDKYNIEILFNERKMVGTNLCEIIKERGYTKISFSKAVNISRPTLNHLFEGEINSITTFEKHIDKISAALNMKEMDLLVNRRPVELSYQVVYSSNEPDNYRPGVVEMDMFEILRSLIDLCDFYY